MALIPPCTARLSGAAVCILPDGHPGPHEAFVVLPPDVAKLLGRALTDADAAQAHYRTASRWYYIGAAGFTVAIVANLIVSIMVLTG